MNTIAIDDLKANPNLLLSLFEEQNKTWVVRREGDAVTVHTYPTYSDETKQLLAEAKAEYAVKKQQGYSREEAIEDFNAIIEEINQ